MRTTKVVLFVGLGVAALILLTSDKAKEIRDRLEAMARMTARKWQCKLGMIGGHAANSITELKEILGSEIDVLNDDSIDQLGRMLDNQPATAGTIRKILLSKYPELIYYL